MRSVVESVLEATGLQEALVARKPQVGPRALTRLRVLPLYRRWNTGSAHTTLLSLSSVGFKRVASQGGDVVTALPATSGNRLATTLRSHPGSKSDLALSFSLRRLVYPLHVSLPFIRTRSGKRFATLPASRNKSSWPTAYSDGLVRTASLIDRPSTSTGA